jgi:hypothetical protein
MPGSSGAELDRASEQLFRPMDWEPWHVQVQVRTRETPEAGEEEPDLQEPTAAFEESGITAEDADETIAVYLEKLETSDAQPVAEGASGQAD